MGKAAIFLADGCEECEGLLCVDILRRAGAEVVMASISDSLTVKSSHEVEFCCDELASQMDFSSVDMVILPGGIPGTYKLGESETVADVLKNFSREGKKIAAVCAAPSVLAQYGLLEGKKAIAHKKFRDKLHGAIVTEREVVVDGNITTAWGLGASIPFALELARQLQGEDAAERVRAGIDYEH
jgi:4-methyl-5(b-hydroxyethyl)-thiazole monophosphate biosynthesis